MSLASSLKLRLPTIILLSLSWVFVSVITPLILKLIEDSTAFENLKADKPIDSLISILSMPTISSPELSIPVFVFSLLIASVLLNVFLLKRMSLYYQAAEKFGEWFCGISTKYAELSGNPVTVKFKENDLVIDKDFLSKNEQKL